ncbi:type IA DNA topoisomerase [Tautonia plasticadhaerens]|uniref:DNA topoisomerase n=1 Tax=Tautonia plasticadhaerens TaxID=2527974 RepID=A0A518GYW5_9BACT|nr:type IA DNA topoisomerase [Tautonia plasticadhaerens]QDV33775.1 DNA topoisomerase 3 [Tautonia plasticadhaerens]
MIVVIAEKPSVARELAAFLGASQRREGYLEGNGHRVTWALGHLVTLKEPEDYDPALKKWSLERLPIVPDRFELKPIAEKGAGAQLAVVRRLLREADEVIVATDAGREGELIARSILELTGTASKPARRLWLSSLTREAIRDAFARLRPLSDYDDLYAAARCRSEADWLVGLNATRYQTVRQRSTGVLWSVGRVQTPVLALIVRRDEEIRTFRPEPFWELMTKYRSVTFSHAGGRFTAEDEARTLLDRVIGQPFVVSKVERKTERVPPPQLFDLTELQREMNRRFGLSADATLKAAQQLYESKLISYPRTDSRHLGRDLKGKIPGILDDLRDLKPDEVAGLDLGHLPFTGRIVDDSKVSDHHAIIPTGKKPGPLDPASQKVFDAIVVRLIAAFYPPCVKEVTTVLGSSAEVPFRARGVRVVEPGWTALYPRKSDDGREDEQDLPEFLPGESGPHEPFVRRGETTPPKPYTEATLLAAMETAGRLVEDEELRAALKDRGLGTPATRASIIETLLTRGYISREKKNLIASDLGRYLIALVRSRELKSPELTGEWEARLREIERGGLDPARFMAEIARFTSAIVDGTAEAPVDPGRLGECPRCGRPVIRGKRAFGCSGWKDGCPFVLDRSFEGITLDDDQIRELLQLRVLPRPVSIRSMDSAILRLADSGDLLPIPVPQGRPRPSTARPGAREQSGRPRPRSGSRSSSPKGQSDSEPAVATRPRAQGEEFAAVPVGTCPRCGSEVVEQPKSWGCSSWKGGCSFAIWKSMSGKRITARMAKALLTKGRTAKLKGFKSKAGKPFEAVLVLDGGEVRFDFD